MKYVLLFVLLYISKAAYAQGYLEIQKLISSEIQTGELYGFDVDIYGDFAVVGAKAKQVESNFMGGAYILKKQTDGTWAEHQILLAHDRRQFDSFAHAVAIYGDYIVVGALGHDYDINNSNRISAAGAVYIFKRDTNDSWNFVQKIVANDRSDIAYFGSAVAIYQNTIVVGAERDDFDANGENFLDRAGAAYIFEEDTNGNWNQVKKIIASERGENDRFGSSVSIDSNWIAVGAYAEDEDANDENTILGVGAVYLFKNDNNDWNFEQKIVPEDRNSIGAFGWSVDLEENTLVIGAFFSDVVFQNAGTVHVFDRAINNVWSETQVLTAEDGATNDRFGQDVAIQGNRILVGALTDGIINNGVSNQHGSVYLFLQNESSGEWYQQQKILASDLGDAEAHDFGVAVGMSGDDLIVGNSISDDIDPDTASSINESGSVYTFSFDENLEVLNMTHQDINSSMRVYPNPVKEKLTINLGSTYSHARVEVYNTLGQYLTVKNYRNKEVIDLALNGLEGMYIIKVTIDRANVKILKVLKD